METKFQGDWLCGTCFMKREVWQPDCEVHLAIRFLTTEKVSGAEIYRQLSAIMFASPYVTHNRQ